MAALEFQSLLNLLFILPLSYLLVYWWKQARFVKASARGIDPVGEAEVFLFQGKTQKAIRVLRAALAEEPTNVMLQVTLLRALGDASLVDEYGQLAAEVECQLRNQPIWQQIQRTGREMEPGNALYH